MESKALSYVVKRVHESGLASLQEIMKHRLTEECLIGTLQCQWDLQKNSKKQTSPEADTIATIDNILHYTAMVDIGMICRLATPTVEDRDNSDGSPRTWGDYANKMA